MCVYIYIYTNFVEYNRHFLSTYFLVDPFILPYWFYSIRREFIDIFSIIVYFQSTFCPTLGHHQGWMYYKSDLTYVCTLLLCKKKSIWAVAVYGPVDRESTNGPGDLGSIPGRVIPKILKMVLGTSLLNSQQYKVRIKGKVEQSR